VNRRYEYSGDVAARGKSMPCAWPVMKYFAPAGNNLPCSCRTARHSPPERARGDDFLAGKLAVNFGMALPPSLDV
jgi:hypothetical protein